MSWPARGSGGGGGDTDISGLLVKSANLSDLTNAATARTNMGVTTAAAALSAAQAAITLASLGGTTAAAALAAAQTEISSAVAAITLAGLGGTTAGAALAAAQAAITLAALGGTTAAAAASAAATLHNLKSANLSDVANAATALANLGGVGATSTTTLTNKRYVARVNALSGAIGSPTYSSDNYDLIECLNVSANITDLSTNLTGAPNKGDTLTFHFTAATADRTIGWGTKFEDSSLTKPTTITYGANIKLSVWFEWNSVTSKWRLAGYA
jgi:hypothetical protein